MHVHHIPTGGATTHSSASAEKAAAAQRAAETRRKLLKGGLAEDAELEFGDFLVGRRRSQGGPGQQPDPHHDWSRHAPARPPRARASQAAEEAASAQPISLWA